MPEDIRRMIATLPRDLRDQAILLVGFFGGLRRSEIVDVDNGQTDSPEPCGGVEVHDDGAVLKLAGVQ